MKYKILKIVALIFTFIISIIGGFVIYNMIGKNMHVPCDVFCEKETLYNEQCHFGILGAFDYVNAPLKQPCLKKFKPTLIIFSPTLIAILFIIFFPIIINFLLQRVLFKKN
ncbi:MAG: hypothetical protein WC678_01720 [Parcubacteria group bacterium]|jgi:hypothetical protein